MESYQSESITDLVAAIVKAQLAMVPAVKDHVNPYFKSKYADLPSCWEATAAFRENGIAITQSPMEGPDGFVVLDTQLSHVSGQWMRSRIKMKVAKDDPQGYGSAITYARRYALGAMTGLVTEEDDDGNPASQPQRPWVLANKQTAQAKIAELAKEMQEPARQEARKPVSGTSATGTDDPMPDQQQDSAAPYTFQFGQCKGKSVCTVADSQLSWYMQHYTNKLHADPNSRYASEWEEACLAIEQENQRRADDPTI